MAKAMSRAWCGKGAFGVVLAVITLLGLDPALVMALASASAGGGQDQAAPAKPGLEAAPTVLLVKDPAGIMQIVDLTIEFPGAAPVWAAIQATIGDNSTAISLGGKPVSVAPSSVFLQPGRNTVSVRVPA